MKQAYLKREHTALSAKLPTWSIQSSGRPVSLERTVRKLLRMRDRAAFAFKTLVVAFVCFRLLVEGDFQEKKENVSAPEIRCPPNQTFCEDVPNYPTKLIRKALLTTPGLLHSYEQSTTEKGHHREQREASDSSSSTSVNCKSEKSVIYPLMMNNTKGEEKNIINNIYYLQPVNIVTCSKEGSWCYIREPAARFGWIVGQCVQKFAIASLITYDPVSWTGAYDTFAYPSECGCSVVSEEP